MRLLPGIRSGSGGACRARLTARDPTYEPNARVSNWVPMFMLIWFSPSSFIYETPYGGAEKSPAGRSVVRLSTLTQALAFGKKLEAGVGRPGSFSYSVGPATPILLALTTQPSPSPSLTFALGRCTRWRTAACGSRAPIRKASTPRTRASSSARGSPSWVAQTSRCWVWAAVRGRRSNTRRTDALTRRLADPAFASRLASGRRHLARARGEGQPGRRGRGVDEVPQAARAWARDRGGRRERRQDRVRGLSRRGGPGVRLSRWVGWQLPCVLCSHYESCCIC
eukprot:scaffold8316_cov62-Phaeocystis_antarctica.AAC.6